MRTSTLVLPFLALLPALACTARSDRDAREAVREAASPVVGRGARADLTHDAVVAVRTIGTSLCSGTIVRRNEAGTGVYVLTAAHCCRATNPPRRVFVGSDYTEPMISLPVASFQQHPCYNPLSNDYDFCVLEVEDEGALNITPIPLATAPDELEVGSVVTVVGYGSTPATNTIRRRAAAELAEVAPLTLAIDQTEDRNGICFGDSGGPLLINQDGREVVAGVISFGASTSLCNVVGAGERVAFRAVRDEFLDKVLAGQQPTITSLLIRRNTMTPGQVRDTYLASDAPDRNFGDHVELLVGTPPEGDAERRALIRFELVGLPAGATVMTARVGLHLESRSGPGTLSVHRVTRDWDERHETWASFGAKGFDPTPLAVIDTASAVVRGTEQVWFDATDLVTRWASGEENHGLLLREPEEEETQLLSSEIGRTSERPWMSICYVPAKK